MAKMATIIEHDRIIASDRMIPIGARPQINPNLEGPIRTVADAPTIPTETPSEGWIIDDVSTFALAKQSDEIPELIKPYGLFFNDDGTEAFTYDIQSGSLIKFSLSTAYDASTLEYDSIKFVLNNVSNFFIDQSGTYLFLSLNYSSAVYVYTMTVPWDIETLECTYRMSFDNVPTTAIYVSDNGFHLYVATSENKIFHFRMSHPLDLSTSELIGHLDVGAEIQSSVSGIVVCPDGTKMYVLQKESSKLFQYETQVPYHMDSAEYEEKSLTMTGDSISSGLSIVDESNIYSLGFNTKVIYNYSIEFDLTHTTFVRSKLSIPGDVHVSWIDFNPDGTYMYSSGLDTDKAYQYELSVPWDVSSFTTFKSSVTIPGGTYTKGGQFSPDGTKFFVTNAKAYTWETAGFVIQYILNTPWELGGGISSTYNKRLQPGINSPKNMYIRSDGLMMYIWYDVAPYQKVYQYELSSPWDLTTLNSTPIREGPNMGSFNSTGTIVNGTKLYWNNENPPRIIEYTFGIQWDISTITPTGKSFAVTYYGQSLYINSNFDMYLCINDDIYQYKLNP